MNPNEQGEQRPTVVTDKTVTNEKPQSSQDDIETLKAQKSHWREKAIDPETGKTWKEMFEETRKNTEKKVNTDKKKTVGAGENLIEKAYLRSANIVADDEVELALDTAKKWGLPIDKLVDDEDFKIKLERLRVTKSNVQATSDIKGSGQQSQAKNEPTYWLAKGVPPTATDVPDRKIRTKIIRAFMNSAGNGKKFYND